MCHHLLDRGSRGLNIQNFGAQQYAEERTRYYNVQKHIHIQ